jgi:hypothetical protein
MSTFQTQIQDLAASFVDQVVNAIRGSSLQELLSPGGREVGNGRKVRSTAEDAAPATSASSAVRKSPGAPGRLPRRSPDEIKAGLGAIVGLLQKHKEGLRAEQIRSNLGLQSKEMPRILKEGISTRVLRSKGQKRATTYFAK